MEIKKSSGISEGYEYPFHYVLWFSRSHIFFSCLIMQGLHLPFVVSSQQTLPDLRHSQQDQSIQLQAHARPYQHIELHQDDFIVLPSNTLGNSPFRLDTSGAILELRFFQFTAFFDIVIHKFTHIGISKSITFNDSIYTSK